MVSKMRNTGIRVRWYNPQPTFRSAAAGHFDFYRSLCSSILSLTGMFLFQRDGSQSVHTSSQRRCYAAVQVERFRKEAIRTFNERVSVIQVRLSTG